MKKVILTLFILMFGLCAFASDADEALNFFNNYIKASNSYDPSVLSMYSDNAKIIRQVVKPSGELVNVPFSVGQYRQQLKLSAKVAKLKNYKNYYSNIHVLKNGNGYKIEALRKPSASEYKLKASLVVQKQPNDKWIIVEELMQTKEQIFLKYVK